MLLERLVALGGATTCKFGPLAPCVGSWDEQEGIGASSGGLGFGVGNAVPAAALARAFLRASSRFRFIDSSAGPNSKLAGLITHCSRVPRISTRYLIAREEREGRDEGRSSARPTDAQPSPSHGGHSSRSAAPLAARIARRRDPPGAREKRHCPSSTNERVWRRAESARDADVLPARKGEQ
eukprot:scaffold194849_cov29-Tisochrysis_lutea.AAC.1